MREADLITVDNGAQALRRLLKKYRVALLSTLISGLVAHMYIMTNILLNIDATTSIFSKGATLSSGRWALEWTEFLFPNYSMPWLYGLVSLIFISLAVALTVEIFKIESPVFQALLGAVAVTSSVMTATLCYMFTSAPYCFAIMLSVLAVYLVNRGGKLCYIGACLCLCVSLGYYQAYIALSASFLIALLLKELICDKMDAISVLKLGLKYLAALIIGLILYALITYVSMTAMNVGLHDYGYSSANLLLSLKNCYTNVLRVLFYGYSALVPNTASAIAHLVCLLCAAWGLFDLLKNRGVKEILLALLLLLLLPIAINCLYFAASVDIIHTLVKAGYVSIYVLCIVFSAAVNRHRRLTGWVLSLAMLLIAILNINYSNTCYLKMQLQYENAFAFYTNVGKDIKDCDEFEPDCTLAMVGYPGDDPQFQFPGIDTSDNVGLSKNIVDSYSRGAFLRYFIGLDLAVADWDEINALKLDERVISMPEYPSEGYVQRIDNYIVAKF